MTIDDPFYSVVAIHIRNMPSARLGIVSPVYKEVHIILPVDCGNIWVYGMNITLTSYISRSKFRRQAKMEAPNSRVFQYDHTKTKNMAVPVACLNPLQDLFARTREWESQK